MNTMYKYISLFLTRKQSGGGEPPPPPGVGTIDAIELINANTDVIINPSIQDNDQININGTPFSFRANTSGNIGSIQWKLDGCEINISNHFPGIAHKALPDRIGDYDGLCSLVESLIPNATKTREEKNTEARNYLIATGATRPLNFDIGYRTLEATPYSGPDLTGVKGATVSFELQFNTGTNLGSSRAEHFANDADELKDLLDNTINHDDIIRVAPGIFFDPVLTINKRVKIIGAGRNETFFTGFTTWTINAPVLLEGFNIIGPTGNALDCPNGTKGVFLKDIAASGKSTLIYGGGQRCNGLVADQIEVNQFRGNNVDVFDYISTELRNFSIRNVIINDIYSNTGNNAGRCHGLRLGSVAESDYNQDIMLYNIKIDKVRSDDNTEPNAEVHGIYTFGSHVRWEKVWITNMVPRYVSGNPLPDREAGGGKMLYALFLDCWFHNPGSTNQEGCLNLKNEDGKTVIMGCLVTADKEVTFDSITYDDAYPGWCFNVYGDAVVCGNTGVHQQTQVGFGLASLRGKKQRWMGNRMHVLKMMFVRIANHPNLGHGYFYGGSNTGSVYNRNNEPFYKEGPSSQDFEVHIPGNDTFCPVGNDGSGCGYPFTLPNWADDFVLN